MQRPTEARPGGKKRSASRIAQVVVVVMFAGLLLVSPVDAQGQGRNRQGERNYDPASVTSVTATVQEVLAESGRGGGTGTHLVLETESGPMVAHLGPAFYLAANEVVIKAGDSVTITGSQTVVNGETALIAREIRRGDSTLVLRNEAGRPAWRGEGPRASTARRGNGRGARTVATGDGKGQGPQMGTGRRRMGRESTDEDATAMGPRRRRDRDCAGQGPRAKNR